MTREELMTLLGTDELYCFTREQLCEDMESVLDKIDAGYSPVLITAEGKPDLLIFGWEDYKRRYAAIYPPEKFERIEKAFRQYEETQ